MPGDKSPGYHGYHGYHQTSLRDVLTSSRSDVSIARGQQMKILLSNCGVDYGDGGGPLLNDKAEVVGVTFAKPTDAGTASFAYHIHADEVKQVLEATKVRPAPAGER